MHEWALAESIIDTIAKEAKKNKLRKISAVRIKTGELQHLDLDILKFALENILPSYDLPLNPSGIDLQTEKSSFKCRVCGNEWMLDSFLQEISGDEAESIHFLPEMAHACMRCARCNSPDFELLKGRGIWIDSIEAEK